MKTEAKDIHFVQPIFISIRLREKKTLVLVTTAGSATTSSFELPALGADVGPGKERP